MKLLDRDFLVDNANVFALFQDKAKTKCVFALDTGSANQKFDHESFGAGEKCNDVLASGKLEQNGTSYYIAMFKSGNQNRVAVMSANKDKVITAEKSISMEANKSGKLADMKAAKKAVAAAL